MAFDLQTIKTTVDNFVTQVEAVANLAANAGNAQAKAVVGDLNTIKSTIDNLQATTDWKSVAQQVLQALSSLGPLITQIPGLPSEIGVLLQFGIPLISSMLGSLHTQAMAHAVHAP